MMTNVTKTSLPPLEEYVRHLHGIWERGWLTNNGVLLQELEKQLKATLEVPYLHFVTNGTLALQIAIKALNLKGQVITTPFSYVATTNSIIWEGCEPVFVDIEPRTFCIEPELIEAAITPYTTAILATHVYGFPCAVDRIETIAKKHRLKVIYDGAHAFGVRWQDKPLLAYGDIATLSTHATKIFHTIEGGAIMSHDPDLARTIGLMRSFGHVGDEYYLCGINAKASEFQAAMGLCMLPKITESIARRKKLVALYGQLLQNSSLRLPEPPAGLEWNYGYYPVVFQNQDELLSACTRLRDQQIFPRRYFYPTLNNLPYAKGTCPVSEDIAPRILCLPLFDTLEPATIQKVCELLTKTS